MTPPAPLKSIIGALEQHPDAERIKKLLIYTAVNRWESDPQLLQRLSLERIVAKNLDQFSSLKDLEQALSNSVSTLSRPATYGRLANEILTQLRSFYGDKDPSTGILKAPNQTKKSITEIHLEVADQTLEGHRENIRIKKLLYALSFQRWENSFQVLEEQTIEALLRKLIVRYPTRQRFETVLWKLISLLNRQQTYHQLAEVIIEAISPLYQVVDAATGLTQPTNEAKNSVKASPTPPPLPPRPIPEAIDYKQTMAFNMEELPLAASPQPATPEPNYKQTMAFNFGDQSPQTMVLNAVPPLPLPDLLPKPAPPKKHFAAELNIYELKLEVMKYANPLRTKILLFSAVHHPFDLSGKDWSMLRTCDFDELLSKVLRDASSPKALDIKLSAIARSLFDANEHLQAAAAITQALNLLTNSPSTNL